MIEVELLGYKIKEIDMHNNLSETGLLQLESSLEFNIDFVDDNGSAKTTLIGYAKHRKNPDMFFLKLELQAIFGLHGIENNEDRDEASIKCYNELFLYYKEIMTYLAENTGLDDFDLDKPRIFKHCENSEVSESNDKDKSKIIELNPDIDV